MACTTLLLSVSYQKEDPGSKNLRPVKPSWKLIDHCHHFKKPKQDSDILTYSSFALSIHSISLLMKPPTSCLLSSVTAEKSFIILSSAFSEGRRPSFDGDADVVGSFKLLPDFN